MLQADICMEIFVTDVRRALVQCFPFFQLDKAVISAIFIKIIKYSFSH